MVYLMITIIFILLIAVVWIQADYNNEFKKQIDLLVENGAEQVKINRVVLDKLKREAL